MTTSVADVLAQLRELLAVIDQAAVTAARAQTDAQEAQRAYHEAGTGTKNTHINQAITQARTAGEKTGKIARLLGEAASAYADYINTIAPGTLPARHSAPEAMPTGEQLLDEAEERGRRADAIWRRQTKSADDMQDTLENAEKGARAFFSHHKDLQPPTGQTTASTGMPHVDSDHPRPDIDNPLAAIAMAAAGLAVAARGLWSYKKKREERENDGS
jgi:hypothetical protein